jgi:hypothetical protein
VITAGCSQAASDMREHRSGTIASAGFDCDETVLLQLGRASEPGTTCTLGE